jgi:hypothetical protein
MKPKVFSDGTIRYDQLGLSSICEPQSLNEALGDEKWKKAMDEEFTTRMKNKT